VAYAEKGANGLHAMINSSRALEGTYLTITYLKKGVQGLPVMINSSKSIRGCLSDYNVIREDINSSKNNRGDLSDYGGLCRERLALQRTLDGTCLTKVEVACPSRLRWKCNPYHA